MHGHSSHAHATGAPDSHNMSDMPGMPGMPGMSGMSNMSHMSDGMMSMFFHTGYSEYILFQDLHTNSVWQMVIACLVIFILAMWYEGLKVFREQMLRKSNVKTRYHSMTIEPSSSRDTIVTEEHKTVEVWIFSFSHLTQTALHILQVTVSYCLMLVFMTYNVWLCISVVLGAGAGYFAFGWKRAIVVDINEHCH
ncbi:high affinity copper uptake protein 1-like isoform X4 [Argonauta hians]